MFNNETQDATNIINQLDDKQAPNMSLSSNGGGVVNLNATKQFQLENSGGGGTNSKPRENWGYQHDTGQTKPKEYEPIFDREKDGPIFGGKNEIFKPLPGEKKPEIAPDGIAGAEPRPPKPKEPEKTPEEPKSYEDKYKDMNQGELQTALENINKEIEDRLESISWLEDYLKKYPQHKDQFPEIDKIKKEIATLRDEAYWLKNNSNYDNRTDDQIRADKSTQLKVDDYIKAGLNPAGVGGYYGSAGGGGGSSSSNDEEERKRKKREKELAEQRKKEKRQEMTMKMLSMLMGSGNVLGSAGIRAKGFRDSANIRNQGLIDNTLLKDKTLYNLMDNEDWAAIAKDYLK